MIDHLVTVPEVMANALLTSLGGEKKQEETLSERIDKAIAVLDDKQLKVFTMSLGLFTGSRCSLEDIAEDMKMSVEEVDTLLDAAFEKMKA